MMHTPYNVPRSSRFPSSTMLPPTFHLIWGHIPPTSGAAIKMLPWPQDHNLDSLSRCHSASQSVTQPPKVSLSLTRCHSASQGVTQPPKVSLSLPRCHSASQGVTQPPKVSLSLPRCHSASQGVTQPPKVSLSLPRCHSASQGVTQPPKVSLSLPRCHSASQGVNLTFQSLRVCFQCMTCHFPSFIG